MENGNTLSTMYKMLADAMKPMTDLMELAAFWTGSKRYVKGDNVYLDKSANSFTKQTDSFTHKITKLMGNLQDTKHEVHLEDLNTGEPYIITM